MIEREALAIVLLLASMLVGASQWQLIWNFRTKGKRSSALVFLSALLGLGGLWAWPGAKQPCVWLFPLLWDPTCALTLIRAGVLSALGKPLAWRGPERGGKG